MRIIFSRKGFDSAAGGGASPIVDGRPISLPIPAGAASVTTYDELGLAEHVSAASRGRYAGADLCHHDPMFLGDGTCLFGQVSAAQTHLENRGVGVGDVFVFFGLFRGGERNDLHHRIFGYLRIEAVHLLAACDDSEREKLASAGHPHALAMHGTNDAVYVGPGRVAKHASDALRLTVVEGPPSLWNRPAWLKHGGLSYHDRAERWLPGDRLQSVARGQEFVADIGQRLAPRKWLDAIVTEIERIG